MPTRYRDRRDRSWTPGGSGITVGRRGCDPPDGRKTDDDARIEAGGGAVMARVLITGSTDGLGLMAARLLADAGHAVTLHARNQSRAAAARAQLPEAEHVVVGDLASIDGMHLVAEQANALGRYHAVIHNAGVGYREPR